MLLDHYIPHYDIRSQHQRLVAGTLPDVYARVRNLDFSSSWLTRLLFTLRGLPTSHMNLGGMQRLNFALLQESPPTELVMGIVGQFWRLRGNLQATNADHFLAFAQPGYAKSAFNFSLAEAGNGQVLVRTETRILCLDDASRRRFKTYWSFIGPFSGLVRTEMLRVIVLG